MREGSDAGKSNWSKFRTKIGANQRNGGAQDLPGSKRQRDIDQYGGSTPPKRVAIKVFTKNTDPRINGKASKTIDAEKEAILRIIKGPWPSETYPLSKTAAQYIALDCEMVGVGHDGKRSSLAHVVCTDWHGRVLYNKYVKQKETVTNYRTQFSGILPHHLVNAIELSVVQKEVAALLNGKILVGHSLENDLRALLLSHPKKSIRDTAMYNEFRRTLRNGVTRPRKLRDLVKEEFDYDIQTGEHDPAEDARAAMAMYRRFRIPWEHSLVGHNVKKNPSKRKFMSQSSKDTSSDHVAATIFANAGLTFGKTQ